jgi:LmbE family N-acetylglucosaminyl deacetylase
MSRSGGVLARYAAEGVETYLATATSGEWGWPGASEEHRGEQQLARIREAELRTAAGGTPHSILYSC